MRPDRLRTARRFGTRTATALVTTALAVAAPFPAAAAERPPERPSALVDPLIGSANGGNTFPGATLPYGMIAWSPTSTTGDQTSTGAANGYQYDTTRIRGLSLTHVNGAGCNPGAAGDVPIMPFVGDVTSSPSADTKDAVYAADFSHADEKAVPGRYTLGLKSGATADLAVSRRASVADFTFPSDRAANLLFRVSNSLNGSENAHVDIDAAHRKVTGWVHTGAFCGRRANGGVNNRKSYYKLYFSASFDRAFSSVGTWKDSTLSPGSTTASGGEGYATGADRAGRGSGGWVGFDTSSDNDVRMRLGISYVSLDGAEANLREEIEPDASVTDVATAGARAWDRELSTVRIQGGSPARRQTFYTALYHSLMQPNLISDVDGRYWGMDQAVHRLARGQRAQYSNFSGWDQYRAQIQLLALLKPTVAGDFAQSLYNFAQQNGGVWDRWVHISGATHVMTGDPSAATLATFYAMGVRNFDYEGAFDSLVRQATVPHPDGLSDAGCPGQCVGQRPNLAQYLSSHYAAQDVCHCWGGAAETLEDAVADSALAKWAKLLGRETEAKVFAERATYWRNVFNPEATPGAGYIQARRLDGSWVTPSPPPVTSASPRAPVPPTPGWCRRTWRDWPRRWAAGTWPPPGWTASSTGRTAPGRSAAATRCATTRPTSPGSTPRGSTTPSASPGRPRRRSVRSSTPCTAPDPRACPATTTSAPCPPGTSSPPWACIRRLRAARPCCWGRRSSPSRWWTGPVRGTSRSALRTPMTRTCSWTPYASTGGRIRSPGRMPV